MFVFLSLHVFVFVVIFSYTPGFKMLCVQLRNLVTKYINIRNLNIDELVTKLRNYFTNALPPELRERRLP